MSNTPSPCSTVELLRMHQLTVGPVSLNLQDVPDDVRASLKTQLTGTGWTDARVRLLAKRPSTLNDKSQSSGATRRGLSGDIR